MNNSNQTSQLIKWIVISIDFIILNGILLFIKRSNPEISNWITEKQSLFFIIYNVALGVSEYKFYTIIHFRFVTAGEILKRVIELTLSLTLLAFLLLLIFSYQVSIWGLVTEIGGIFLFVTLIFRYIERQLVKSYRKKGNNVRSVTLVGNDTELLTIYEKLYNDATLGYKFLGIYTNRKDLFVNVAGEECLKILGSLTDLLSMCKQSPQSVILGNELYLCVSRNERETVKAISQLCDNRVVRFFYVPVSVESLGVGLKREMLDDIEIYTTYENPLQNPVNRAIKRLFDVIFSLIFLVPTAVIFPLVFIIMKIQSPGPILFKQKRTGLDGNEFEMLKFRSMHVNADADKVQATKDDPRKYPFGNFMRKTNIDELPQFINVLKGDMSIVGPRPHMLAHTEQYSALIEKYMVRHFVKPGVTGWAQVTGFRGETKELWQMEGRVKRDIWYIENWSIWLDVRIIWLTLKSFFIHDEHAY